MKEKSHLATINQAPLPQSSRPQSSH